MKKWEARCARSTLLHCLLVLRHRLAGRNVVWFCDNTNALHCFIRCTSANVTLERVINVMWLLSFHCHAHVWIGWIDSVANWKGGISRQLGTDQWMLRHQFTAKEVPMEMGWWSSELPELMSRAESAMGDVDVTAVL